MIDGSAVRRDFLLLLLSLLLLLLLLHYSTSSTVFPIPYSQVHFLNPIPQCVLSVLLLLLIMHFNFESTSSPPVFMCASSLATTNNKLTLSQSLTNNNNYNKLA